ncbi:MAG TPA: CcdB family protein [Holophagaceae bacterium]|nr:CcdB family protein [Holophagaceae bacterium]
MAQWTVHRNPNPATRGDIPFLLDAQSDLLSELGTRMVIPMFKKSAAPAKLFTKLTPALRFKGESLVLMVPQMAGVRLRELGEAVGDLSAKRAEILAALDLLLTGI